MCVKNVRPLEQKFNAKTDKILNGFKWIRYPWTWRKHISYFSTDEDMLTSWRIFWSMMSKTVCVKFIGITLDQRLYWRAHIDYIPEKVSKSVGILHKVQNYLDTKTLRGLYYSLINPHSISSIVVGLCLLCCTNCLLAVVVFSSSCLCPVAVMGRVTTSSKCSWGWLIDSWGNGVMTARGPILLERLWFRNSYSGRNQVGAMMGQK